MYLSTHEAEQEGHTPVPLRDLLIGKIRQTELARQVGCSVAQLNQYLLGKRRLNPVQEYRLQEIANHLLKGESNACRTNDPL